MHLREQVEFVFVLLLYYYYYYHSYYLVGKGLPVRM